MKTKINQLLMQWPKGTVATSPWLLKHGVSRQLARRYTASGWIESLGRGAFLRTGDAVDWSGGVYSLQTQLGLSVYAGGGTALSLKGLGHFLPLGEAPVVTLFHAPREKLPGWFTRRAWGVRLQHHGLSLFESADPVGFTDVTRGEFSLRISAPERAILEVLHLAATNDAITHALELMRGLSTLQPSLLQNLLEACRSIKVKRLFLWAAETAGHDWVSRLSPERLTLGQGKRALYRGGSLDPKYRITVPLQEGEAHV